MRTILCAVLVMLFGVAGCQQKEASNKRVVAPPQAMISAQQVDNLRSLAKMNPGKADGWIALGNALMDTQQFGEAIDAYQKALALDPKNVDVRVDMGTCMRGVGKYEAAVAEFRKAIKIAPGHLNAHRNLGVVLGFDLKDSEGAIREFKTYLELAPNTPDAAQIKEVIAQLQAGK
jgi:cytochrome c-type biogenesis protein CcmH/NrfG